MMRAAERFLADQGIPKLNLMIRAENHAVAAFYRSLGYTVEERVVMARALGGDSATGPGDPA
jgi:ribosomal protein S18 acetylase RimI-like enzyme